MKKRISIITFCLVALFVNFSLALAASDARIEKIEFASPSPNEDRITFKLNGAHLPKIFALKGDRPRVVFDFADTFPVKGIKNIMDTEGAFIKQIRTGIHKGSTEKTRIVFDLIPGQEIDFSQDFDQTTNTLVIRIFPAGLTMEPLTAAQPNPQETEAKDTPAEPAAPETMFTKDTAPPETASTETVAETEAAPPVAAETETKAAAEETPPADTAVESPADKAVTEQEQVASIPKSEATSPQAKVEESTKIQPLSAIGESEKTEPSTSPVLYSIEFDDSSSRGEMIIFKMNEFYPPVVFGIEEDIPRIVCFFKDTAAGKDLGDTIESNGQHVKSIKIGKYRDPDNIRVVLDLVPDKNYDLQQIFFKEDNLFMIIINTTGEKG